MASNPSKACCELPPVVASGYKEKGEFSTVSGLKTYTTGPPSAKKGIFFITDIFGFFPQSLQGADLLAHSDKHHEYRVVMPDFFDSDPCEISLFPPDNDEKKQKFGAWWGKRADTGVGIEKVNNVMSELKSKYPDVKEWGILGFCWGGKVTNLVSQQGSLFKAAATAHPAMVDPKDAPKIIIPMLTIASKDENADDVNKYDSELTVPKQTEFFKDQIHGFMAARSDLDDENVKTKYKEGYEMVLAFFNQHV